MATTPRPVKKDVIFTTDRVARLYKLLTLLGQKPQTREAILKRLKWNVRGFYRDLDDLRKLGILVTLNNGRYTLADTARAAQERLPIQLPRVTLGEAQQLAKGRTAAHARLKKQIAEITG